MSKLTSGVGVVESIVRETGNGASAFLVDFSITSFWNSSQAAAFFDDRILNADAPSYRFQKQYNHALENLIHIRK